MKKKLISSQPVLSLVICLNLMLVSKSHAQDFHLSQFDAFSQYLNPAMTGMFNGDYRANIHIRRQWASVIANPFITTGAGFDISHTNIARYPRLKDLKLGAYVINERAGTSKYNVFNFAFSGAYDWAIKKTYNHVAAGLQLGLINKSINFNDLFFQAQYNNQNGGGFNTSNPTGEVFTNTNNILADINIGTMYYYAKEQSRLNPFFGATAFHINHPKENFFESTDRLPRRYNLHGGTKINLTRSHQLNLHFLMMQQTKNVREYQACLMGMSFLKGRDDLCFLYGFAYRKVNNEDAQIAHLGMQYQDFTCRVSYDVNVSSLKTYSSGRGGFEISLIYVKRKPVPVPPMICPRI